MVYKILTTLLIVGCLIVVGFVLDNSYSLNEDKQIDNSCEGCSYGPVPVGYNESHFHATGEMIKNG